MTAVLRRVRSPDLDDACLYELLKLRVEVFVVEQAIEDGIPHIPMVRPGTRTEDQP